MTPSSLYTWFTPPPRDQDGDDRARHAFFVTIAVIVLSILISLIDALQGNFTTFSVVVWGYPPLIAIFWLLKHGRTKTAITMLLIAVLLVLTGSLAVQNGIHDVGVVLYPVITMLAGALIGRKALALFLFLVTFSVFFIVLGEAYGFLPHIRSAGSATLPDAVIVTLIMSIAAYAIRLMSDARERSLRLVRASEDALNDKVRKLQLLREISLVYASELDLASLIRRIYDVFPKYFRSAYANILIYSEAEGGLVSDGSLAISRPDHARPGGVQYPGESISGQCYESGTPIVIDDCAATDIIPKEWVEALNLRSCLAVPLKAHNIVLGVLRVDNTERTSAFSQDDVEFVKMLGEQIAIGLQNQKLFEERRRIENALRESERSFRLLSDNVTDLIWTSDLELKFRFVSASVERMLGWTQSEFQQLQPDAYLPPSALIQAIDTIRRELARNAEPGVARDRTVNLELQQRRKDGTVLWTEISAKFLWEGDMPTGIIGVTRDIQDRKDAEERLRKSENSYRSLVANIPNSAIVLFDHDMRFILVDGPETDRTGLTKDKLEGRTLYEVFPPEYVSMFEPNMKAVLDGRSHAAELPYEQFIYRYSYVPLMDNDGTVEYGMILAQNVTDQRKAEEEVHRLNLELEQRVRSRTAQLEQANKELEAFSYSVSHDLRAPIRHIHGYLSMLEAELGSLLTPTASKYLKTAEEAAQRMATLIDDLLKLSRLLRTEMHTGPVDLSKLMRELKFRFNRDGDKRSDSILVDPTPLVIADKGLIEIALQNLLSNALKFTAKAERPRIEFGSEPTADGRIFYIRDNGSGFDMAYAGKLFGVFQRLHNPEEYPGTGIGLATVQRILQRHGGRIWAEGEVGKGATFFFTLPLA